MSSHDRDGEADSLFGSPPPSPVLGIIRGGSPDLALPGRPGATCPTMPALPKNVGTIALPGSHNCSELEDSLPASPFRPQPTQPIHPMQQNVRQFRIIEWAGPRATSLPVTNTRRPLKKKKAKSATPHSKDNGSSIALQFHRPPGVRSPQLSALGARGMTREDPIVVEEVGEEVSPNNPPRPAIIPTMGLPTRQSIADALISQGNLFPVLRSLMPYFGVNPNVGRCYQRGSTTSIAAPPLKRRKLNSVPAGAKDWDVPYPFPANEGPPNYLEYWQKKRGKKLMMKLVSLVRDAVQRAAGKSQTQEESSKPAPEPSGSNLIEQPTLVMGDGWNTSRPGSPSTTPPSSTLEQEATVSDDLSTLFGNMDASWNIPSDFDSFLGAINNTLSDPNVQLTGNDLEMASSYSFSPTLSSTSTLSSSTRSPTPSDLAQKSVFDAKDNVICRFQDLDFSDIPIDPGLFDTVWANPSASPEQNPEDAMAGLLFSGDEPFAETGSQTDSLQSEGFSFDQASTPAIEDGPAGSTIATDAAIHASPITIDPVVSAQDFEIPPPTIDPSLMPERPIEERLVSPVVDGNFLHNKDVGNSTSAKKHDRQDTLRRARIRRKQLAAEIARAKIELWETTIEQGVLTHLSKDKELSR